MRTKSNSIRDLVADIREAAEKEQYDPAEDLKTLQTQFKRLGKVDFSRLLDAMAEKYAAGEWSAIHAALVDRARARDWKKPEPGTVLPVSYRETRAAAFQSARSFGPAAVARAEKPAAAFRPGDAVLHKTFGEGMVISASPMGNDTLLEVAFERVGTKKIMANYARLQKL